MNNKEILIKIKECIIKYDKISLFFHTNPDFDTLGSVFALKEYIKKIYNRKEVKILDINLLEESVFKKFPKYKIEKNPNENWIKKSLGIVCDTANKERIFCQKYSLCREIIKIDHHPNKEEYGILQWVDITYSSVCEMICDFLFFWDENFITEMIASYIYVGIYTDTNRFFYSCTSQNTFLNMQRLFKHIPNISEINFKLSERTIEELKFQNEIYKIIKFDKKNKIASLKIPKNIFKKYKIENNSMIWTMANIEGIEIWTSIYYDEKQKKWKGSIRSKSSDISIIASKYGGGGHEFASGFALKKDKEFDKVIEDLIKIKK